MRPKKLDSVRVLKAIARQQGILVERSTDAYSFSHLTLQEYLVARHINSYWLIDDLVGQHLVDQRWREIFLCVSGLTGGRSHFLWIAMEDKANSFIQSSKLQALFKWAAARNSGTASISDALADRGWCLSSMFSFARARVNVKANAIAIARARASAIAIAITSSSARASARAIASAIAIASVSARVSDITSAIAIASASASDMAISSDINVDFQLLANELIRLNKKIPNANATANEWKTFAQQLTQVYFDAFYLNEDIVTLTCADAQNLEKYFYSVQLILDCKAAAVRVFCKEWKTLESRLLTVSEDKE